MGFYPLALGKEGNNGLYFCSFVYFFVFLTVYASWLSIGFFGMVGEIPFGCSLCISQ